MEGMILSGTIDSGGIGLEKAHMSAYKVVPCEHAIYVMHAPCKILISGGRETTVEKQL